MTSQQRYIPKYAAQRGEFEERPRVAPLILKSPTGRTRLLGLPPFQTLSKAILPPPDLVAGIDELLMAGRDSNSHAVCQPPVYVFVLDLWIDGLGLNWCSSVGLTFVRSLEASRRGCGIVGLTPAEREVAIANVYAVSVAFGMLLLSSSCEPLIRNLSSYLEIRESHLDAEGVHRFALRCLMPYDVSIGSLTVRPKRYLEHDTLAATVSRPGLQHRITAISHLERRRSISASLGWERRGAVKAAISKLLAQMS
ncbi:hypothetical protein [Falsiroseomonas sp. CW058]|uniref:hypothetical protein n=1 Tax=Falsiroseomonas sp. CW058 TaxID=3388664 RepID=UPI003D31763C